MNKLSIYLLGALMIFSACGPTLPLRYQGHSAFTVHAGSDNPTVQTTVVLYNPNRTGATITRLNLDVNIGKTTLGNIQLNEPVRIRRKQPFELPLSLSTTYARLTDATTTNLAQILGGGPVPFALEGEVTLRKFLFFKRTFDVAYADSLRLKDLKF